MRGSIQRYCTCRDPATKKQLGKNCPALERSDKHGLWEYRDRVPTSKGYRQLRRRPFRTRKAAIDFQNQVRDLLELAYGDPDSLARVGDLISHRTRRAGQLPEPRDVRRRLGIGLELNRSMTVAEWLEAWYAGKRRAKRASTLDGYRAHLDNYLLPHLGHLPIDRCTALHFSDLF